MQSVLRDRDGALRAAGSVLLVNLVGSVVAILAGPDSAWVRALETPALYPQPFSSAWCGRHRPPPLGGRAVARSAERREGRRAALGPFAVQMAFDVDRTPRCFALQAVFTALAGIVVPWLRVAATIAAFARVDRRAAASLVPHPR